MMREVEKQPSRCEKSWSGFEYHWSGEIVFQKKVLGYLVIAPMVIAITRTAS